MARSKTGQAISEFRRTGEQLAALDALLEDAKFRGDLDEWRRARGVRRYIDGKKVTVILEELGVSRSTVNTWLRCTRRWARTDCALGRRRELRRG